MSEEVRKGPLQELFIYVALDDNGDEGIIAAQVDQIWAPLISGDRQVVEHMRPYAIEAASVAHKRVKLYRFENPELLDTFEPEDLHEAPAGRPT